ncbi:efflux RND transporter permease subunit [Bradyrhizobium macuxiense]|uniref:efflux RND transporter permease subunit n=1 Tax=Bradyrhizobium macuxiense TaxID=1755647 RepID=UPI0024BFC54F|nr:efflux RND transporter permease subunit [Bradyrhizobium macuxiense]
MATMAALLGALALALCHGDGAELRVPLGISLVSGLHLPDADVILLSSTWPSTDCPADSSEESTRIALRFRLEQP